MQYDLRQATAEAGHLARTCIGCNSAGSSQVLHERAGLPVAAAHLTLQHRFWVMHIGLEVPIFINAMSALSAFAASALSAAVSAAVHTHSPRAACSASWHTGCSSPNNHQQQQHTQAATAAAAAVDTALAASVVLTD